MSEVGIFVGSVYGNGMTVAEQAKAILTKQGHDVNIIEEGLLEGWFRYRQKNVLIVTSTTGRGDFPDSIKVLYEELEALKDDHSKLKFGIIALGDCNYDDFCLAGKKFDELLKQQGAHRVQEILMIDADTGEEPQDVAEGWIKSWGEHIA